MSKLTLNHIDSLTGTSAVQTINTNLDTIVAAFDNTLSRDGTIPNTMSTSLDMNSQRILNLPAASNDTDPVRKIDLSTVLADFIANAAAAAALGLVGAASTAVKWLTGRTITLTGDVTGVSGAFDGSANLSFATTIAAGAVTNAKLASGAAVANIGYTPANKAGDTLTGDFILADAPASLDQYSVGFRGIPQVVHDANYTLVIGDAGKAMRHSSATAHAWTIPPNASVVYPVGTTIVVRNTGTGAVTLTRGSGVSLFKAGSGSNADVTLAQWGLATLMQEAPDVWVVAGTGVS